VSYTREFVEKQYNNRALVPAHAEYFARWEKDSNFVRETLPGHLDIAYGPHARNRVDLFSAGKSARGTLIFIHGGYWRSLDKNMFTWLAAAWVAAGVNIAMLNYRLAPEVRIDHIVDDIVQATNWLAANGGRYGVPADRLVVSGHSAGGHLTAALFATPREKLAFDPSRIIGGVPFSGIFDFEPMLQFAFNADFKLDDAAVARLSLLDKPRTIAAKIVPAAGGNESSEFQRQSRVLAEAWSPQSAPAIILPGLDHFSIVDSFAERGQPLYEATLALF
jgi:arylformamidase